MAYSSIQRKKCKCGCNRYPSLGYNGYSYNCAPQEIKDKVGTKREVAQKNRNARNLASRKLHSEQRAESHGQNELERWFHQILMKHSVDGMGCTCMECGSWIPEQYMRHATAHLLPKKLFKSCATHPLNYLILGAGCGCHAKTDRVDLFCKMKVWPEAARRIKIIMPNLPFEELQYLSSQLLAELDKI